MKAGVNACGGKKPSLELHLSRSVFAAGQCLSGVVTFRLPRPTAIHSIKVGIVGNETPAQSSLKHMLRTPTSFFSREILLSGRERPRRISERIIEFWDALLGRPTGRMLSAGEHVYPFSIALPASLPPSYCGRAGEIRYRAITSVEFPVGRRLEFSTNIPLISTIKKIRSRPIALSYPTARGAVHASRINIQLQISQRATEAGELIRGHFSIDNPEQTPFSQVSISLESCEWVRDTDEKGMFRTQADLQTILVKESEIANVESDFSVQIPEDAIPTVEGTTISVIWLLRLALNTSPPLELKTPLTIHALLTDKQNI